ncbi:uncharacterized protein ARMOST_22599 [Armillaria ostoyae]|uniref:Uncharacterized protein n=1 Tax=Armillaria ostoyae TaxID=47428 RepID=A0A284SDB0_ARMOS|nr:uncharacterized protein ARMOST_22599 [Armillaria ostoyae]
MNCEIYFQVQSVYMWLDPYRVTFTSSYFKDKAEEWWILELADLRSATRGKFRFPTWLQDCHQVLPGARNACQESQPGVPASYTLSITNIGILIPVGYEEWKKRIIMMNRECQKKQVQDQVVETYQPRTQQHAGASKGSSGLTTSSANKKTATSTTYRGRGQAMDIDAMRKAGECF